MNYAGNTEIIGEPFHDLQKSLCITALSIIPLRKTLYLFNEGFFIQGAFKKQRRDFLFLSELRFGS